MIEYVTLQLPKDAEPPASFGNKASAIAHANVLIGTLTGLQQYLSNRSVKVLYVDLIPYSTGEQLEEQLDKVYESMLQVKAQLALVFNQELSFIITLEKGHLGTSSPYTQLRTLLENRVNSQYFHTELLSTPPPEKPNLSKLIEFLQFWEPLGLFPKYHPNQSTKETPQFGFVAMRSLNGFFITGRGQQKQSLTIDDFTYVSSVTEQGQTPTLTVTPRKATLNAPLAFRLFRRFPNAQFIVHMHIFPFNAPTIPSGIPGTTNDTEQVTKISPELAAPCVINQQHHGCYVILENLQQFTDLLLKHNAYSCSGDGYDLLYSRFLGRTQLFDLLPAPPIHIVDLAAGTGHVSSRLIDLGFKVTSVEQASAMKTSAVKRDPRLKFMEFTEIPDQSVSFGIIRQAYNYVCLNRGYLSELKRILNPAGEIVFNTFKPLNPNTIYSRVDYNAYFKHSEASRVGPDGLVYHIQQCTDLKTGNKCVDFNIFYNTDINRWKYELAQVGLELTETPIASSFRIKHLTK